MSNALEALKSASRRGLQALAKELQLCRGNSKSDVIVSHAKRYLDCHPKDGEQMLLGVLGRIDIVTPVTSPIAKKETLSKPKNVSVKKKSNVNETESDKMQQEDEPITPIDGVKMNIMKADFTTNNKPIKDDKPVLVDTTIKSNHTNIESPKPKVKASPSSSKKIVTSKRKMANFGNASPGFEIKEGTSTRDMDPVNKALSPPTKQPVDSKDESLFVNNKAAAHLDIKACETVEALLSSNADLKFVSDSRVRCSITGHEMKADLDTINTYIRGKRYQKARNLKLSFAKYAPMFVDHSDKSKPELLWCTVTESAIIRDETCVKKHIAGTKYQKRLPIWKQEVAAKKKMEEEEALRQAARSEAARKRRLEAGKNESADTATREGPVKRKRIITC
ncbi:hypothetical protein Plhal304r1_c042g0120781 [Plasmopara halstedii]